MGLDSIGVTELVLLAAALLIGATGTWSPCGFSMIETLGPNGHTGGRATTFAACLTFLPGALAGAIVTFAGLAWAGGLIHGAGAATYAVAAALAVVAAILEAKGNRIMPQIRRQLPEHWRRVMPMPIASALYGVLLGLGFTTFVLSFGVWALAGISFAVGEPSLGLAIGIGFGVGRALPIVTLAPIADLYPGRRAVAAMAERPGIYRGIRIGDAGALGAAAVSLILAAGSVADAGVQREARGADPGVWKGDIVYQHGAGRRAAVAGSSGVHSLPGTDPAIGGPHIAVIEGNSIALLRTADRTEVSRFQADGADAVALSPEWVAYRTRHKGRDAIRIRSLANPLSPGEARTIARAGAPAQLSRPSLARSRLAYATANAKASRIQILRIGDRRHTVLRTKGSLLTNPALFGKRLLYVRTGADGRDHLTLKFLRRGGGKRQLLTRKRGHLWSTALTGKRAYVTVLSGGSPAQRVFSLRTH